jgi:glycosyltransferase EpsD
MQPLKKFPEQNKILFLSNTANFSKFNLPYMKFFREKGWQVDYCSAGEETVPECDNQFAIPISRSPFSFKNFRAYRELRKILLENDYRILHCHTPMGGVLGRLAAKSLWKKGRIKIIYTAHGFHFYKGSSIFSWLFYFPVEKFLSCCCDVIVTINEEDYEKAKKCFVGL